MLATFPPWRRNLNIFVRTNVLFERLIFMLIFLNCVTICLDNVFPPDDLGNKILWWFEAAFTLGFFAEMIVKMVARGILVKFGGYFSTKVNIFDCLIVVFSMIGLVRDAFFPSWTVSGGAPFIITAAQTARLLRPVRSLNVFASLRLVFDALAASVRRLIDVFALVAVFTVVMALIALQFFRGSLDHRCFVPTPALDPSIPFNTTINVTRFVDGNMTTLEVPYYNFTVRPNRVCGAAPDVLNAVYAGQTTFPLPWSFVSPYVCPFGQICLPFQNPERDRVSFDYIVPALTTFFSVLVLENWAIVMYYTMDGVGTVAGVYFLVTVLIGTIFILNLFLVMLTDGFTRSLALLKRKAEQLRLKNTIEAAAAATSASAADADGRPQQVGDAVDTALLVVGPNAGASKSGMVMSPVLLAQASDISESHSRCSTLLSIRRTSRVWVHKYIVGTTAFELLGMFAAVVNVVVLSINYHGMSYELTDSIDMLNDILTLYFVIELVAKLLGTELNVFFAQVANLFDCAVCLGAIIEFFVAGSSNLSVFRCIRLLRLLRLSKSLRETLSMLTSSLYATVPMLLLLAFAVFLFGLLGVQLFQKKLCGLGDDDPATLLFAVNTTLCDNVVRYNFDNIGYGIVTVFIIIVGDGWRVMMVDSMSRVGDYAAIYYIIVVCIGTLSIVNLFVSVLIYVAQSKMGEHTEAEELDGVLLTLQASFAPLLGDDGNRDGPTVESTSQLFLRSEDGAEGDEMEDRSSRAYWRSRDGSMLVGSASMGDAAAAAPSFEESDALRGLPSWTDVADEQADNDRQEMLLSTNTPQFLLRQRQLEYIHARRNAVQKCCFALSESTPYQTFIVRHHPPWRGVSGGRVATALPRPSAGAPAGSMGRRDRVHLCGRHPHPHDCHRPVSPRPCPRGKRLSPISLEPL